MCDNNTNIYIDTVSVRPLTFWKEHQARFPAIAALARDTLSFPATGAGVERLFNTARDICHYRRGRMKSETVEALMMFLCTTKFDMEKQHRLQAEANNYRHLRSLQGNQIPVCLGTFTPQVLYWYHGELMAQMMILSWSGKRLQYIINDENSRFFHQERDKALTVLRSHGVIHGDSEWRNILWDDLGARLFVIDLEEVKWLKCPRALEPTFGNMRHSHRVGVGKSRKKLLSSSTAVCS